MNLRRLFLFTPIILFTLSFSCKSPSGPEPIKNPREYTWEVTMLAYPGSGQTQMYSIWGSSTQDVYACGYSQLSGQKGAMYHYDGKLWTPYNLPFPDYNFFWKMTGFAANDVWVAGSRLFGDPRLDSAVVLHYDGSKWKQMLPSHMGVRGLKSMGGTSSQNLYFSSRDGKVIRYDGVSWKVDTLYLGLSMPAISGDETRIFAMGNTFRGALDDSVMCFTKTSGNWNLFDWQLTAEHSSDPRFGSSAIYTPTAGSYYCAGYKGVFHWEGEKWRKVLSVGGIIIGLGGSGPNNILAVGWRSGPVIYHWDGTDWAEIKLPDGTLPNDIELYDAWTNGKEAFVVGNNGGVSYVLHGK